MSNRDFGDLYAAARRGDRAAREELVERFRPRVQAYVERHTGADVRRRAEPEDVYQTAVLTFLSRLASFRADLIEEELLAYALQIAKWRIADVLKRGTREQGESVVPSFEVEQQPPSTGPVTRKDEQGWTRERIRRLPEAYACVLWCYYVDGKSTEEVARELDIKPDLVRQRLARGRRLIKEGHGSGA